MKLTLSINLKKVATFLGGIKLMQMLHNAIKMAIRSVCLGKAIFLNTPIEVGITLQQVI